MLKKLLILFVLLFGFSAVSAEVVESVTITEKYTPNTYEPDPWIIENVTITNYKNTSSSELEYEDDGGDQATIPGTVQKIYLDPMQIVSPLGLQKPIEDGSENGTKWLVTDWSGTYDSVITEAGVKKLKFSFPGNATGIISGFYDLTLNSNISDYSKKHFVIGLEVIDPPDTNESYINYCNFILRDSSTDYSYNWRIHPTATADYTMINKKGVVFYTAKVTDGMVGGSSGNLPAEINEISIFCKDTNPYLADSIVFEVFALGIYDKVPVFGTLNDASVYQMYENDSGVMTLDTFKPSFKWEKVTSFGPVEFKMKASDLEAKYTLVDYEELSDTDKASYTKSYDVKEYFNFTFKLPAAVDLTYDGSGVLKDTLNINSQQYDYVSVQTGTADPVQKTGLYTGARSGDTITVLSSMAAETTYSIYYEVLLTQAQWEGISEAVGVIYGSSDSWWNRWWLWLAGLLSIGYGVKRRRKGGK